MTFCLTGEDVELERLLPQVLGRQSEIVNLRLRRAMSEQLRDVGHRTAFAVHENRLGPPNRMTGIIGWVEADQLRPRLDLPPIR